MQTFIICFIALFVYWIEAKISSVLWDKKLEVSLCFSKKEVRVGEQVELLESVKNEKKFPVSSLHMKFSCPKSFHFTNQKNMVLSDACHRDDMFFVMGQQLMRRRFPFVVTQRGYYQLTYVDLVSGDYFGLKKYAKRVANEMTLLVFPEPYPILPIVNFRNQLVGEVLSRNSVFSNPYTFEGLREYEPQNSMKDINWKATARCGQLMVNRYQKTCSMEVTLLLNMEPPHMISTEGLLERSISIASSLSEQFCKDQIPYSLMTNGINRETEKCCRVKSGCGKMHLLETNRCLARVTKSEGMETLFSLLNEIQKEKRKDKVLVVISPYHKKPLMDQLDEMIEQGYFIKMILPYYSFEENLIKRDYIVPFEMKEEKQ